MATTPTAGRPRLSLMNSAEFATKNYRRHWLVENILVAGQPCVVGGPSKSMKTSLVIDLAISLGSGTPFLGKFDVPEARTVAVYSGESGVATIQETAIRIAKGRGLDLESDCQIHWAVRLPRLSDPADLKELKEILRSAEVEVVVIDPLYLCLLAGGGTASASNLFEIGPVLADVSETCMRAGATPVLVHHSTKTAASGKKGTATTLNDLAFAGIGEFARQWLLVNRRAPYRPGSGVHDLVLSVGGSAGHSAQWRMDIDEGVNDADTPDSRKWNVSVEPDRPEPEPGKEEKPVRRNPRRRSEED
jgi:replicative DNA helicase